jgi:hypothetical protein
MEGFRLSSIVGGQRQFFLKADAFAIRKRKIGFFKFGLLNEARFEGVLLRLYGRDQPGKMPEKKPGISERSFQLPDLASGFHKKGGPLAMVPAGRLSGIVMHPVTVEVYRNDNLLAKITADKAYVRARDRQIVFEGQVRMTSQDKWLTTRRMTLTPQTACVSIETTYRRYDAGRVEKGRRLQTDLALNPIIPSEKSALNDA